MEEEEEIEQHVPYASRPDWAGVSPIPIPETEANAPVTIAYAPDYAEAMAYFRAICAANEKSERGLELTGTILAWNPAHYTVWKLRQDTLWALSKNLWDELDFVDQMAAENPKSYQIWHHRQLVVDKLGDPIRERPFVNSLLFEDDAKNYHAWSYRQWFVKRFNAWQHEIADTDLLIQSDVRNNSAWNHRFCVMKCGPEGSTKPNLRDETLYAMEKILLAPNNESPWQYLRGLLTLNSDKPGVEYANYPHVMQFCFDLLEKGSTSRPLHTFLVEYYEQQAVSGVASASATCKSMLTSLRDDLDPVRSQYWGWRLSLLEAVQ